MRSKILHQSGKTFKQAKRRLERKLKIYCMFGWKRKGELSWMDKFNDKNDCVNIYQEIEK